MSNASLISLIVFGVLSFGAFAFEMWFSGKASRRFGPYKLLLDELTTMNATIKRIEEKLGN